MNCTNLVQLVQYLADANCLAIFQRTSNKTSPAIHPWEFTLTDGTVNNGPPKSWFGVSFYLENGTMVHPSRLFVTM